MIKAIVTIFLAFCVWVLLALFVEKYFQVSFIEGQFYSGLFLITVLSLLGKA